MAARWLIAALCLANVVAVFGVDCTPHKKCADCVGETGCSWCAPKISIQEPGATSATETVFTATGVCKEACDDVSFGTLGSLFDFEYGTDGVVSYAVGAVETGDCPTSASDVEPDAAEFADCAACKGEDKVWCPLTYDSADFDATTGAICMPADTVCGDVSTSEIEGLTFGEAVAECPAAESTVAPTAAPGAAAPVPRGGMLAAVVAFMAVAAVLL